MNPHFQLLQHRTRRHFLRESTAGIGGVALASLLAKEASAAPQINPLAPEVLVTFAVEDGAHLHVPLLLSPHGYTTYRGS